MSTLYTLTAYEKIKQLIISTKLPPGSAIDEKSLIKQLNIGRTPIHTALNRLALEQLVETIPRRGTFVTGIDIMDLPKLFEFRTILEIAVVGLAVDRATNDQIINMEKVLHLFSISDAVLDNQSFIEMDKQFHMLIYDAANNKHIKETLEILYAQIERIWCYFSVNNLDEFRATGINHRDILLAIKDRDKAKAEALMADHTIWLQERIVAIFK